jgi:hypothetical protein
MSEIACLQQSLLSLRLFTDNQDVKSPAKETLSRWLLRGVPLLVVIGIVAIFALRSSFNLSLAKLALPIAVLMGIQLVFYVSMFGARQRYKRTQDLRAAVFVMAIYSLCIGLAGMYYAGQLGIASARTFDDNYVGFSAYMGVVTFIAIFCVSFGKPKPHR